MANRKKGAFETPFIITFMVFIAVLGFLGSQMAGVSGSTGYIFTPFNFGAFGTEIVGVAVACTVTTGLLCVAAAIVSTVLNFFVIPPVLAIIFAPLLVVLAYIIARLARGGG